MDAMGCQTAIAGQIRAQEGRRRPSKRWGIGGLLLWPLLAPQGTLLHPCFSRLGLPGEDNYLPMAVEMLGQVLRDAIRTDPTHDRLGRLAHAEVVFQAGDPRRKSTHRVSPFSVSRATMGASRSSSSTALMAVSRTALAALTLALAGASASCMTLRNVSTASPVACCTWVMACCTTARRASRE